MTLKTIVIAGGGTAGWMAAAALGHLMGEHIRIHLVESEAIGTVGVGEATIPQIRLFNQALGLDEDAFLRATGGTFKLGIAFDGWTAPRHSYMHAFGDVGRDVGPVPFQHYWLRAQAEGVAGPLGDYCMNEVAARAGRMHRGAPLTARTIPAIPYAFHFDANLYAAYLRRFAQNRGVSRTEGRIAAVERDGESGDVTALVLDGGERVAGDLFLDCTGFRALLIEGALQAGYEDWSRWLPCDRAVAQPSTGTGAPLPYTRAIARSAGWQWRIPLQHRTGNGHVYCSAFTSDDEAMAVLAGNLDGEPTGDPRPLRFVTGRRRKAWSHNVVALGLASGFLEPLESTSIHLIQAAIARLVKLLPAMPVAAALRSEYNRQTDFEMERIRDFLILHYWANGREEPFWQACRTMALPDSLQAKIDLWRETGVITREHEELFTEDGWLQVLAGQGVTARSHHPLADTIPDADLAEYMETLPLLYRREAGALATHESFIARHCAMRR
ncbi:tryptophan halogenase family protein [Sphingomonas sp.]|uniref:tryptophan halogenase family protein n=1 Tax=Sphingomonas sp. TaxID=28214 RepID=UPI00258BC6D0|nr:tryptophan halogenase family protein [Sphingomonas sp.]